MKIANPFDVQSGGAGGVIAGLILAAAILQPPEYQHYFVLCWIVAVVLSNWPVSDA